jgi:PhnB protein
MGELNGYVFFDGNCAQAMRFYERTLGAKLEFVHTVGESPMAAQMPPGSADKIMHARLRLDGHALLASDWMAPQPYEGMKGFRLCLSYPTVAVAQQIFDALADGGKVSMPFQKTYWAEGFGMLEDRFGVPWMVNVQTAAT